MKPIRGWQRDLLVLVMLGVALTALFATTNLDIAAAAVFYDAQGPDHWPHAQQMPWSFLYRAAPWITASLAVVGLVTLIVGLGRQQRTVQLHAAFVLLSLALGPGLVINTIFKDHWERPRPRDIVEFNGQRAYALAPLRGEGGKSFPCGHCSVGFLYALGWWIWRRRHPGWAVASLATGLVTGTALGLGRMAAGGHFLSDVAWSALLALGMAHMLYRYVLRIPNLGTERADVFGTQVRANVVALLGGAGGLAVLAALFATPHGTELATEVSISSLPSPPQVFELTARTANVEILISDMSNAAVSITGELHGFGLPTSRLQARTEFASSSVPTLSYRVEQIGWFTDLDAAITVRLPSKGFDRIVIRLERGDVTVTDISQDRIVETGRLQLDIQTGQGQTQLPRRSLGKRALPEGGTALASCSCSGIK